MKKLTVIGRLFSCGVLSLGLMSCQLPAQDNPTDSVAGQKMATPENAELQLAALDPADRNQSGKMRFPARADNLLDYGDPNFKIFIRNLKNSARQSVHILQLGDSHTAADVFSGQLRARFQGRFGDGGIGLLPPGAFNGIRQNTVRISAKNQWDLSSTRSSGAALLPIGGYAALPNVDEASLTVSSRNEDMLSYRLSLLYQASRENRVQLGDGKSLFLNSSGSDWVLSKPVSNIYLPLEITLKNRADFSLGGLYLTASGNSGVIYSASGVNGATQMDWDKWAPSWPKSLQALAPDMVVLAYGSNEATHPKLDLADYRATLTRNIQTVRQALPDAVILLLGAPDSMRANKAGKNRAQINCRTQQPVNLSNVIEIQRAVARKEKTLFWGWQDYMGGVCSMQKWNRAGLARDDLVHFTAEGYKNSANALYQALQALGNFR